MAATPSSPSEPRTLVTHPELRSHQSCPFFQSLGERPKIALERFLALVGANGFKAIRIRPNFGHNQARMTFRANPAG